MVVGELVGGEVGLGYLIGAVLSVAIQAAAVCVAAGLLLLRVARVPAWNSAYAED